MESIQTSNRIAYRSAEKQKNRNEVILPPIQNRSAEISVQPSEDAVVATLQARPSLENGADALLLARSIAGRIARSGDDALAAQSGLDLEGIRKVLG